MDNFYYRESWCRAAKLLSKLVTRGHFSHIFVEGAEHIPEHQGTLICPCHRTDYDVFVMIQSSPRRLNFMGKSELFNNALYRPVMYRAGGFPVKRDAPDRAAVEYAKKLLMNEEALVIYPEGELNKTKSPMMKMKQGPAKIALDAAWESGKPIAVVTAAELYFPTARLGANAYIGFNKPFYINDFVESYQAESKGTIAHVTSIIEEGIVRKIHEMEEKYHITVPEEKEFFWMV